MEVDRKLQFNKGYALSAVIIAAAMVGWYPGFDFSGLTSVRAAAVSTAKITAFGGMAMFAWSLILSGRYKFLGAMFGGLDKMYLAHRFFGTFGLALIALHPIALTLGRIPVRGWGALSMWVSTSPALMFGMLSLYGMLGLIIWSITSRVRHETFIKIHKFLGALFAFGVIHAFMAGSVLATNQFMYWYMFALCFAAMLTFIHYSILADFLHREYKYTVKSVRIAPGGIIDIRLKPRQRLLSFRPGQFVYLAFSKEGLKSFHPFSIASGAHSSELHLAVKPVGDFTHRLSHLHPGALARLKGPYGGFTFDRTRHQKQLWIAGGIGITPFLSQARTMARNKFQPHVEMVYTTKNLKSAYGVKELEMLSNANPALKVTLLPENKLGMMSLEKLHEHFKGLYDYAIYICGPPPMLKAYAKQAKKLGLDESQIFFEEFNY